MQRKYLETNTGAFPGAEFETRGEITHLTEPSEVLEILFQFIYPRRHPEIEELEFPLLAAVAEAAEKYEVFSGMSECKTRMRYRSFAPDSVVCGANTKYNPQDILTQTRSRNISSCLKA